MPSPALRRAPRQVHRFVPQWRPDRECCPRLNHRAHTGRCRQPPEHRRGNCINSTAQARAVSAIPMMSDSSRLRAQSAFAGQTEEFPGQKRAGLNDKMGGPDSGGASRARSDRSRPPERHPVCPRSSHRGCAALRSDWPGPPYGRQTTIPRDRVGARESGQNRQSEGQRT